MALSARERLARANKANKESRGNTSTDNTIYSEYLNNYNEGTKETVPEDNNINLQETEAAITETVETATEEKIKAEEKILIKPVKKTVKTNDASKVSAIFSISQLASNIVYMKAMQDGISKSSEFEKIFRNLMEKEAINPSKVEISIENINRKRRPGAKIRDNYIIHADVKDFINNESRRRLMSMSDFVEKILIELKKE